MSCRRRYDPAGDCPDIEERAGEKRRGYVRIDLEQWREPGRSSKLARWRPLSAIRPSSLLDAGDGAFVPLDEERRAEVK